ncbi:glycosyltransferase 87 family protein [Streptomyces sp. LHD-70]|uniref:glycosyltransferase 87 family protein n=1 Tax=Streptomyces sp. LHD-70 TaxID=3072140 RepID=UPI0028106934|nr:glycosyltransferase 87 family protein [Streptomyces sp. LHD-70]MDQ8700997.1 glycosyltransferase 87 family protein [Streptomyces sp. LHD-70]
MAAPGRRRLLIALLVCLASFSAFWVAQRLAGVTLLDVMVYRAEGWTVRNGGDLYALEATIHKLPTTYPPFAALLFTPLTLLGVPEMRTFATGFNLVLVLAVVHLSLRLVGVERRSQRLVVALWVAALLVWCEPVWTTLRYGQINLLLAVLVLWDLTRRPGNRWAGIGIGIAAAIKLTPALFAVMLALAGLVQAVRLARAGQQWWNPWLRRSVLATVTFLAVTAASWLVLPYDSKRFWTEMVFAASRPGQAEDTANQSLRGVLARLLHTADPGAAYTVVAALVAVAGLTVAVVSLLRARDAWAVTCCAVTALLISPISWSHHWVWIVPVLILLGAEARRTRGAWFRAGTAGMAVLFFSFALWWVPHAGGSATSRPELDQNAWQFMLSAGYTLAGLAFLAVAARRLRENRHHARVPVPRQPQAGRAQAVANE